jgi:hypothetical protein
MRVTSSRPLSVDETVEFALEFEQERLEGTARVLRMQGFNEYALRFEELRSDGSQLLSRMAPS